jgi:Na+/H+ antiporter NhaD/arsenite permease-like protein
LRSPVISRHASAIVVAARHREAWSAPRARLLMLVTGIVTPESALQAVVGEWNLFLFSSGSC